MARRHTVLVVDDEPALVKSVQDLLRLDYRVLGATRAEDGLRLLEENEVDVVMSDQRMPGMSGVDFLRNVRGRHPEAVRLLFTGYADIKAVIDAINLGNVYRYVVKPWDAEELQSIIREACERHDLILERTLLLEELTRKNDELEEAIKLKTAFIQVASHELRGPITILGALSALLARATDRDSTTCDKVARMRKATERLARLVDQITTQLALGKFEQEMQRTDVDLAELVQAAADAVQPFAELRHLTLDVAVERAAGAVRVDGDKILDALGHLLTNAIKFTPDGGRITIAAGRGADGTATLRVADTGTGMDAATLARLFQPFFTSLDVSHHSSGQFEFGRRGLGLGLSVAKAFVEMHGGTLTVESTPGAGSTFTVSLPGHADVPPPSGRK